MGRAKGVICWVSDSGTFGYIAEDEHQHSKLFLQASKVASTGALKVHQRVSYDRCESTFSGAEAKNVELATEEQTAERQEPGPLGNLFKLVTRHTASHG